MTLFNISLLSVLVMVIAAAASYLCGCISPATIVARVNNVDIRQEGSGNPGTTNVLRTLGKKAAAVTLLIDVLKGYLPTLLAMHFLGLAGGAVCATAALLGHMYPVFYSFKGGKGVATGFGLTLALDWHIGIVALLLAVAGALLSKRMSVGSIIAALSFPVMAYIVYARFMGTMGLVFVLWAAALAALIIYRHRANIARLIRGEEPALGFLDKK